MGDLVLQPSASWTVMPVSWAGVVSVPREHSAVKPASWAGVVAVPGEHSAAKPALDGQDALYVASHSSRVGSSNRKLASDSRKAVVMHSEADQGGGVVSEILPLQCGNRAVRIMTAIEQGRPSAPNRANSCSAASVCTT